MDDLFDDICAGGTLTGVILGNDNFHVNTSFGMAVFYHKDCTLQNAQLSQIIRVQFAL